MQDIIRQIEHVLTQLEHQAYRHPLPEFDGNTLGQHFRHILEFFQCLEKGRHTGLVDYASRERNLLYEDNPQFTKSALRVFADLLPQYESAAPLQVRAEFGSDDRPSYSSTLGRELLFVYDHAIHHLAIIKIGLLCHFPEVQADKNLGVSPSTVKARQIKSN